MVADHSFSWTKLESMPIIAILRGLGVNQVEQFVEVYQRTGFTTVEVTMNSPNSVESISHLRARFPDMNVGAGTVRNEKELEQALKAGAQFIITPVLVENVIRKCIKTGIPIFPGALTPSEIYRAYELGAPAIKVFPAGQFGPSYIKDVLAPLDDLKLIPTGGVNTQNIMSYFRNGAYAVGVGSALFPKTKENTELDQLENHLLLFKKLVVDFDR